MKRTPLTRSKGLARTSGLSRKPFKRKPPKPKGTDLDRASAWWVSVVGPLSARKPCVVCGATSNIEGHHIVSKQVIKRVARERRVGDAVREQWLWDDRNGMALCRLCHARHENANRRVPRDLVPVQARVFAAELGVSHLLDRYYPERTSESDGER